MALYNKYVESFYVKEVAYEHKPKVDFVDEIRILHESLLHSPMNPHEQESYLHLGSAEAVADHILSLPQIQQKIQQIQGPWPEDQWVIGLFRGLKFWLNLRDRFGGYGVLKGDWDNLLVDYMLSQLKEGDHVIDVGANIGVYTLQAARAVGTTGKVLAIEPSFEFSEYLQKSIIENQLNQIVSVVQAGLSDVKGKGRFVRCADSTNPGASYVTTNSTLGEYDISLVTLDSLELENVNFIKLDAQGAEIQVLEGAKNTISRFKPILLTELNCRAAREIGKTSFSKVVQWIENLGYAVYIWNEHGQLQELNISLSSQFDELDHSVAIAAQPLLIKQ